MEIGPIWRASMRNKTGALLVVLQVALTMTLVINALAILEELAGELGGADVVVANAGFGRPEIPGEFEPGAALRLYDTNLLGALRTIDWALPRFLAAGAGHLVGIASIASYLGFPHRGSYCGSKAALRVHLQSLRVSLKPYGIAVTTICPGYVKSELTRPVSYRMPLLWETEQAARDMASAASARAKAISRPPEEGGGLR